MNDTKLCAMCGLPERKPGFLICPHCIQRIKQAKDSRLEAECLAMGKFAYDCEEVMRKLENREPVEYTHRLKDGTTATVINHAALINASLHPGLDSGYWPTLKPESDDVGQEEPEVSKKSNYWTEQRWNVALALEAVALFVLLVLR